MSKPTKSPIKDLPVRLPGQSVREHFNNFTDEEALFIASLVIIPSIFAAYEWFVYFTKSRPSPWFITALAMLAVLYAILRLRKFLKKAKQLKLGAIGEEAVGQYLEEKLRPMGCQVLHDICFESFNIDHVVIGPTGVYSIETKTCSKPARGQANVEYDGQNITVNGFQPDRDPIVQAKSGANSLRELLERTTGKRFNVQPVVLYPGWYVEKKTENPEVWVLNEKALPTFINNSKNILPSEDVSLITFHLKRYVIVHSREKE